MECIKFNTEKKYINDFIKIQKRLYTKLDNTESKIELKKLLNGTHPLSNVFKLNKFLIYDEGEVKARFIITEYPDDKDVCYIGFFECIDDKKVAKVLFDEAYKFAKEKNYKKIVGPVDASFWLKYRLKTNLFDKRPYTGEPYNKDYYLKLFTDNGYKIEERYTSQIFDTVDETYNNEKFTEHYNEFIEKGYVIVKPKIGDFDKCIEEIYHMITKLYSDFPVFKNIKEDTFKSIFNSYKSIINMDMVRMAYYEEKPVGFYISVPNYNNIVYHLNLSNILKIISIKKNPKEYVMLYMGVNPEHTGLGKAIAYSIAEELKKNKLPSIGALTRDGKITQNYAKEKINSRYEYVLLEREVDGY